MHLTTHHILIISLHIRVLGAIESCHLVIQNTCVLNVDLSDTSGHRGGEAKGHSGELDVIRNATRTQYCSISCSEGNLVRDDFMAVQVDGGHSLTVHSYINVHSASKGEVH